MSGMQLGPTMVVITTDVHGHSPSNQNPEPRSEFAEIARVTGAQIASFTSGQMRYGSWFDKLFGKRRVFGAALHAALIAGKFWAIYVTGEDIGLPLALLLRIRRWKGRLVCVVHNVTPKKRLAMRLVGRRTFHRVVTVSERQRDLLVAAGFEQAKVINVRNWVDTEFFSPGPDCKNNGYMMACGAENRDYATLAAAAKLTALPIKVYGQGFLSTNSAASIQLSPNLEICPRVPYTALRDAYAGATAVVLPLNPVSYAAGVTGLIEAMSMGKPLIVTRTEGIADYLDAGRPGVEVAPGCPDDLAEAINNIDKTLVSRPEQGRLNRDWAVAHCSVEAYALKIAATLHEIED